MKSYVAGRLAQLVPVLILTSVCVFLLLYLIPGDPAQTMLGPDARPEQIQALRRSMGLTEPLPVQYGIWVGHVVRGDLGRSFINDYPVVDLILLKFPVTLQLAAAALALGLMMSIPVGVLPAIFGAWWLRRLADAYTALALAVPTFWLGILLVLVFGLGFRALPTSGYVPLVEDPLQWLRSTVLPAVTLGLYGSAVLARYIRSALLEVLQNDYMRTARAKGLGEPLLIRRHALRNALIPVVTVLGLQFGVLIGGAVVTEAIFDWPGMGSLVLHAIQTRDYMVLQGTILFVVTAFVLINLATDIAYGFLDPRIRYR